MRYYTIIIYDTSPSNPRRTYTSLVNGRSDPGALNVDIDIPVAPFATPFGGALVRVWGIPLTDVNQASDLNGKYVRVFGGMQKGLPLANPAQAGLLIQGQILQAFGNWRDTDMTLDLILVAGAPPNGASAVNLTLNWTKGTPLAQAIRATLMSGFPGYTADVSAVSPKLVLAHDEPGFYGSVAQFAAYVKQVSQDVVGGNYAGVDIVLQESNFIAYDGTSPKTPKQIAFTDMIGQATWKAPQVINWSCVMRSDIRVGDYVKLPPGQVTTTSQSYAQYRQGSVFNGVFQVNTVRHVGNFRAEDGNYWVSTYDGALQPKAA